MSLKKFLKRNKKKKGQVLLEYTVLLVAAILAMLAVTILPQLRGYEEDNDGEMRGFERHFKEVATAAGGVIIID